MNIQEFVTNIDLYIKVQFLKEYKLKYVFWMNILYNEICREFAWKYIENQSSL